MVRFLRVNGHMLTIESARSSSDYSQTDCETWRLLVARHHRNVCANACREYLHGLEKLDRHARSLSRLSAINRRLLFHTPWQLTAASGLSDDAFFFREVARKRFPVAIEIRSRAELEFAALPDMFHDIYGHVPYLLTRRGALAHRQFGEVALRGGFDRDLMRRLAALFWFTFETGLVREDGLVKVLGAAIVTSTAEMRNIREEAANIEAFDLDRVLEASFQPRELQPRYFVLLSFAEVFSALRRLSPRVLHQA